MPQFNYLNIDLQIERFEEGYRAQVINSPAGQANHNFTWPFQKFELENFLLRLGRTRKSDSVRSLHSEEVEAAQEFGTRLFNAVFDGDVRDCLRSSMDEVEGNNARLRIRLHLTDTPEFANLPWEYLYYPARGGFLAMSVKTPIVRYLDLPRRVRPLHITPPVRVLVMISRPRNVVALDVEGEWRKLREALSDLQRRNIVVLERLERATLAALQQQLRRDQYHIFHFIGHGGFNQATEDGVLVLEDEQGRENRISGQYLGTILHDHDPLRLVVLNACEGARSGDKDPFAGTAQSLVQQGVPAVVAMQFEITDDAAITFAHQFYGAIADSYPVDTAVSEARKSIFAHGNHLEWATPVLFMRSPDGAIFDIDTSANHPLGARPPVSTPVDENEQRRRAEQYTKAEAFFYTERWSEAVALLEEIVAKQLDYGNAVSLLEEARRQHELTKHYEDGVRALQAQVWTEAIDHLQVVHRLDANYKDAAAKLTEAKRQKMLAELYTSARRLSEANEWTAVLNVFGRLQELDATYPDPDQLLTSARAALQREEQQRQASALYQQAIGSMHAGAWAQAKAQLEEVQRIEPNYEQSAALLERVRRELAAIEERERQQAAEQARLQAEAQRQQQLVALYQQAVQYLKADKWALAQARLEEIQQLEPGYRDTAALLGEVRQERAALKERERQQAEEAARQRAEAAARREPSLALLYRQACEAMHAHEWKRANHKLKQIQDLDPTYRDVETRLAQVGKALSDHEERERRLAVLYDEATRSLQQGNRTQATERLQQIARLKPGYRDANQILAQLSVPEAQVNASAVAAPEVQQIPIQEAKPRAVPARVSTTSKRRFILGIPKWKWWVVIGLATVLIPLTVYLRWSSPKLLRTFEGHTDGVGSVAFAPDVQILASASRDKTIRLWRASDGTRLHTLEGHTDRVGSVAFTPDGQTLASASWDNTIKLWRVSDGTLLHILEAHTDHVESVAFAPDGQTFASASWDKTIRLSRASDGTRLHTLEGHTEPVDSVAFTPDGQTLASASWDKTIRLWRASDGTLLHTLEGHTSFVRSVMFAPDGQTLASGSTDGTIRLWKVSDGTLVRTFEGRTYAVVSVAFAPDGQTLASGSTDGTIRLWKVSDGTLLRTFEGHTDHVESVAFALDGQTLASASLDKTIKLWHLK